MTNIYCDRITCDNNCDCECVLDFIHVDKNGECVELTDNPYEVGCFACKNAQWDADGCTCKITSLLVGDTIKGCKYCEKKDGGNNGN